MKDKKCDGWFGPRCRFEARYDELAPSMKMGPVQGVTASEFAEIIEAAKPVVYVRDVCVRCGHVIERSQP